MRNKIFEEKNNMEDYLNDIFIFLNDFLSKKITEKIIFDYTNKIELFNKNKDKKYIILGKVLYFNTKEEKLYIFNKKVYKPYYNENDLSIIYNFEDIGFDQLINLLIIKYLCYCGKCDKKLDGVSNFPIFVLLNFNRDKKNIIKMLKIDENNYSINKYEEIINKYKLILADFFIELKLNNEDYKKIYKKIKK